MTSNLNWQDFCRIAAALKPKRYNIGALLRDVDNLRIYPMPNVLVIPFRHEANHRHFAEEMECQATRNALELVIAQVFGRPMALQPVWLLPFRDNPDRN